MPLHPARILSGSEYLALPRAPETWLLEPLLPVSGAMLLFGDPKIGKSYAALQLSLTLAGAFPDWLGFPARQAGPVVYVQLDTPRSLWAERLEALRQTGLPIEKLHFADRETLGTWPFDILNPDHAYLLQTALAEIKPKAVIIDTLKESNKVKENDNTEMQIAIQALVAVTQPAALVLVHHAKKPGEDHHADLKNDSRGAGYTVGAADAIVRFTPSTMWYVGRAIEQGSIRIEREDSGLWKASSDEIDIHLRSVLLDDLAYPTKLAKARRLAELTGRKLETCRSAVSRAMVKGVRGGRGEHPPSDSVSDYPAAA